MKKVLAGAGLLVLAAACGESEQPPDATLPPNGDATQQVASQETADPPAAIAPQTIAGLEGASADQLTIARFAVSPMLDVSSEAFADDGEIPPENSAYGDNVSPQISWSPGPDGTMSYVLIMEDPDLPGRPPFVHWIVGNIPADVTSLEAGFDAAPEGAFQTGVRENAYFGPRPPSGLHNYTFQVFALDTMTDLEDGATIDTVQAAMEGHVIAAGVLQGTYAAPEEPPQQ